MAKVPNHQLRLQTRDKLYGEFKVDWDTDGWNTYYISGRVAPERCSVVIPKQAGKISTLGNRATIEFEVMHSHIVCRVVSQKKLSPFELSSIVTRSLQLPIEWIAFINRAYYDIVLDTYQHVEEGVAGTFPVNEPFLEVTREGYLFKPGEMPIEIPFRTRNDALDAALTDLTQAVRFPGRTLAYCRMAIESVRGHFDPHEIASWKDRWVAGELAMCSALKLDRKKIQRLEGEAAPSRHGEPLYDNTWEQRENALSLSWEAVYRFHLFIRGDKTDEWVTI